MSKEKLDPKDCSRCTRRGEEFRCFKKQYVFDIDAARELVRDGRTPVELEPDDVRYSVDHCEINEGHLAHVSLEFPGIVGHLFFPDDDGTLVHAHRLIDGHHRATLCMRKKIPFYVYVLTEEESMKVLMKTPPGSIPAEHQREAHV